MKMDIKSSVELLQKEKGIPADTIYDALELALTSAYKKNSGTSNVRVSIDRTTGELHLYSFKTVLKDEETPIEIVPLLDEEGNVIGEQPFKFDERVYITLDEALKIVPGITSVPGIKIIITF